MFAPAWSATNPEHHKVCSFSSLSLRPNNSTPPTTSPAIAHHTFSPVLRTPYIHPTHLLFHPAMSGNTALFVGKDEILSEDEEVRVLVKIDFQLSTSVNHPATFDLLRVYIKDGHLRTAIDQLNLEHGGYAQLVSELQINWGSAISVVKQKAFNKGTQHEDHSMIQVAANQLCVAVEHYESEHLNDVMDARQKNHHYHYIAAAFVNAIWEVQDERERILAGLLLSDDLERVEVLSAHIPKFKETSSQFQIRSLENDLKRIIDERNKFVAQIRQLKSNDDVKDDLHFRLDVSEAHVTGLSDRLERSESREKTSNAEIRELRTLLKNAEREIAGHGAKMKLKQMDHEAQLANRDGASRQWQRWAQKADARVDQLMEQVKVLEAEKAQAVGRADTAEQALEETRLDIK